MPFVQAWPNVRGHTPEMTEVVDLGVLERISIKLDTPKIMIMLNLKGKNIIEQQRNVKEVEIEMSSIGYGSNPGVPHESYDGFYYLHFVRSGPNA